MTTFFITDDGGLWSYCNYGFNAGSALEKISDQRFKVVAGHIDDMMAIDENGILWYYGYMRENIRKLKQISENVYQYVSCGSNCAIAIDQDGYLWFYVYDQNGFRQLEQGPKFEKISDQKFITASCGDKFIMAIDENGKLWTFEDKLYQVSEENFTSVSCGDEHMMAIDKNGFLWGSGCNIYGQLSLGVDKKSITLQKLSDKIFTSVICGSNYSMVVDVDGYLWGSGDRYPTHWGFFELRCEFEKLFDQKIICASYENDNTFVIDQNGDLWHCGVREFNSEQFTEDSELKRIKEINNVQTLMNLPEKRHGKNIKGAHKS